MKTIIDAKPPSLRVNLMELYSYRGLILMLAYRDIKIKYAQAFIGFLWTLLVPLLNLLVLIIVFNKVAGVDTGDIPYPLFAVLGVAGWSYFSEAFSNASQSIIGAQNLVKKVYFPRLVIPLSKMIPPVIDFFIALVIWAALCVYFGFSPTWNIGALLIHLLFLFLTSLTGGLWVSALSIRYRDFVYVMPFVSRLLFFISPIGYPVAIVPETYLWIYKLNPLSNAIVGLRQSLTNTGEYTSADFLPAYLILLVALLCGILFFQKASQTVADYI